MLIKFEYLLIALIVLFGLYLIKRCSCRKIECFNIGATEQMCEQNYMLHLIEARGVDERYPWLSLKNIIYKCLQDGHGQKIHDMIQLEKGARSPDWSADSGGGEKGYDDILENFCRLDVDFAKIFHAFSEGESKGAGTPGVIYDSEGLTWKDENIDTACQDVKNAKGELPR